MAYHSATVYFKNDNGEIPSGIMEVIQKYKGSVMDSPRKDEEGRYRFNVDLGKSTGLDAMRFMRECGKIEKVSVAGGSYEPSLVQRVLDLFRK